MLTPLFTQNQPSRVALYSLKSGHLIGSDTCQEGIAVINTRQNSRTDKSCGRTCSEERMDGTDSAQLEVGRTTDS